MIKPLSVTAILFTFLLNSYVFAFEEITSISCTKQLNAPAEVYLSIRTNIMLDLGGFFNPLPINNLGNEMTFEHSIWKDGVAPNNPHTVLTTGSLKMTKEKNENWLFEGTEKDLQSNKVSRVEISGKLIRYNGSGEPDYVDLVKKNLRTGLVESYTNCYPGLTH